MGGDHHPAGQLVGDVRAEVAAYQVKAEIESRGQPGAGEHVAVVHIRHRVVDLHLRIAPGQLGGVHPVGGGAASVEQPRFGEGEGAGAQGDDPGSGGMGTATEPALMARSLWRKFGDIRHSRHCSGPRPAENVVSA
ncbi:hypothetical protein GCM10027187_03300 [Streptosporangium sandarakinum]